LSISGHAAIERGNLGILWREGMRRWARYHLALSPEGEKTVDPSNFGIDY